MRHLSRSVTMAVAICSSGVLWQFWTPEPLLLSFRVGQQFEEVVKNSSYPVMERSNLPQDDPSGFGSTYITKPSVIIRFDDPNHGFTLPPTNFAVLTYQHATAAMIATSPMLEKLPFNEAVSILENLQNQFKKGGWEPWREDGSEWFDLSPEGKKKLYNRMFEPGYMQTISLRIPKKYGMTFRIKCAEGCWTREPPYKFLIDVGVGSDTAGWEPGDPMVWEKSHPAHGSGGGQAKTRR